MAKYIAEEKRKQVMTIHNRPVGAGQLCFIVGEVGSNHNNDLETAYKLIDVAAWAGVDAVKFQFFRASELYLEESGAADYLKTAKSMYQIAKELEPTYEWIPLLREYAHKKGLVFFATSTGEESAQALFNYGTDAFKIASYELTHLPLIRFVAKKGLPMIISTGLGSISEVQETLEAVKESGNPPAAILHCVGKYPAPLPACNLNAIRTMQMAFNIPVGYSDHSLEAVPAPRLAVLAGASIVEKHYTLSRAQEGIDHRFALEPGELKEMVNAIRHAERLPEEIKRIILEEPANKIILGSSQKIVIEEEKELYHFAKRFIYTTRPIMRGEVISMHNIGVLRSGKLPSGLHPRYYEVLLGKKAVRDIPAASPLDWHHVLQE